MQFRTARNRPGTISVAAPSVNASPLAVAAMHGGWLLVVLAMGKNARWN